MKEVIRLDRIRRDFVVGDEVVHALRGISLTITEGEFVTIMGTSGSGKSTLLNTLGCLDTPTSGEYYLDGIAVRSMDKNARATLRNRKIGFVFQTYNLIARTDALKNVELPMMYAGVSKKVRAKRAAELLEVVGMKERMSHTPDELSGGQKQRVAIARAMANDPAIILADEPTGALDSKTGRTVMDLFHELNRNQGKTIVLITHSTGLAEETDRIITISDGTITGERAGSWNL